MLNESSKRALRSIRNSALAHLWFAEHSGAGCGDLGQAVEEYRCAARLYPPPPKASDALAGGYMIAGRLDDAIAEGKRTLATT